MSMISHVSHIHINNTIANTEKIVHSIITIIIIIIIIIQANIALYKCH